MSLQNDIKAALQGVDAEETARPLVTEASQLSTSRLLYLPKSETRKRCFVCMTNAYGPGYKKSKAYIPGSKNRCQKCGKPVCGTHSLPIGPKCQSLLQGAQFYKILTFSCFRSYVISCSRCLFCYS